ncbi:MAG TPA: hypothetical protein DIT89_07620, partial [Planctomycetaceae bacterium]|nr:hypothetical protein [Planctomycetaceae bacterium]
MPSTVAVAVAGSIVGFDCFVFPFLEFVMKKSSLNRGFTLIELLVV